MKTTRSEIHWRLARLARRRRLLTMAALDGSLSPEDERLLQPVSGIRRLKKELAQAATAASAALAFLAVTGNEALAGGSGLQIETSLQPWWQFLTGTVPWWASTVAIVVGAVILMFSGFGQGGSRIVSALAGAVIAVGAVTWVVGSVGATQTALLLP